MFEKQKYTVDAKIVEIPEEESVIDGLFHTDVRRLIETNHKDQIVVVRGRDAQTLSYDDIKELIRSKYPGMKIFMVVENVEEMLQPISGCDFLRRWLVAINKQKGEAVTYFLGDNPRFEFGPSAKRADIGRMYAADEFGDVVELLFVVGDMEEKRKLAKELSNLSADEKLAVKGMEIWESKKDVMKRKIFVTEFEVLREQYDDLAPTLRCVNGIEQMMVWRDLGTGKMIPSFIEAMIITSAIFFSYEGISALNLIILGGPGVGKSHLLDTIAYLVGTKNHNCMETTLKGLVFSHAERGGVRGVLYRERFIALLNEFMRIVANARGDVVRDDVRRLLSTLNDAVEKKRNRSRSSGYVEGADATMVCSMLTSDNYFPSVVNRFLEAMLEDPSYMRRYAFLRLSKETEKRGKSFTRVADWRDATEKWLWRLGLGGGKWLKVLKFWRSQIREAMENVDTAQFIKYANEYRDARLKEMFGANVAFLEGDAEDDELWLLLREANFAHVAMACALSVAIMWSTFRHTGDGLPKVKLESSEHTIIYAMIQRLIGDLMDMLEVVVKKRLGERRGIKRVSW